MEGRGQRRGSQQQHPQQQQLLRDEDVQSMATQANIDESECELCGARVGKRYLRPRHHCRVCHKAVCHQCSQSSVHLSDANSGLHRVCQSCVEVVHQQQDITQRLLNLARKLYILGGEERRRSSLSEPDTVESAVRHCEELAATGLDEDRIGRLLRAEAREAELLRQVAQLKEQLRAGPADCAGSPMPDRSMSNTTAASSSLASRPFGPATGGRALAEANGVGAACSGGGECTPCLSCAHRTCVIH